MKAGAKLGRYTLERPIAQGGMGDVWLATIHGTAGFKKEVVIKTVSPRFADKQAFVRLLEEEARIGSSLDHPNLTAVYDFGHSDALPYLAMEYVRGRSLAVVMQKQRDTVGRRLHPWFILAVLSDCCSGLHYAHEHSGVIHCDMSPGNIIVGFTGLTKVLDFGAARRRALGVSKTLIGKYRFMAPERIESQSADARTDVYSLGVILYLLFTGKLPYHAETDKRLISLILGGQAKPPSAHVSIASPIEALIIKAMAYDPDERYQTAEELGAAMTRCLAERAPTQDDVAMFMGALFAEATDVPSYIRRRLDSAALDPEVLASDDVLLEVATDELVLLSSDDSDSAQVPESELVISPEPIPQATTSAQDTAKVFSTRQDPDEVMAAGTRPEDQSFRRRKRISGVFGLRRPSDAKQKAPARTIFRASSADVQPTRRSGNLFGGKTSAEDKEDRAIHHWPWDSSKRKAPKKK